MSNIDDSISDVAYEKMKHDIMSRRPCALYDDVMLTVNDIIAIFGCGRKQAFELMHVNGFPSIKIGNKFYVSANALRRWIDNNAGKTIYK